ncbi:hypothetical protein ACIPIN_01810 [Pseudomonas sp. NPDC087697]|uniref:hypothetical protein n=1 Tax=Pseudomonas sp. NPDC087697 TaxID=3364447 RepID=UPI0037FEA54A
MHGETQCVYVSEGWMMYAGPGGFDRSEMVAPSLILSRPGTFLRCEMDDGRLIDSAGLLHASGRWSSAAGDGLVIIYFDPLSAEGMGIQRSLGEQVMAQWSIPGKLPWNDLLFDNLCSGNIPRSAVVAWMENCQTEIRGMQSPFRVDERLLRVASTIASDTEGRLSLKPLSRIANLSPDHLRQLFKQQAGMTLSKYKAWRQLHGMVCYVCEATEDWLSQGTGEAIHFAGFYDDAHGYRALSHYFGSRKSLSSISLHTVNCLARSGQWDSG